MIRLHTVVLLVSLVLAGWMAPGFAAEKGGANKDDPFDGRLLPIELVMHHRQEIGLTAEQHSEIGKLVVMVQKSVAEKQWAMQSSYFELIELLDKPKIDEDRAVSVAREAVDLENDIKTEQIRLLIKVRNLLTADQIAMLRQRLKDGWQAP
ncbi:MAG: hypothetical protein RIC89_15905 [Pseudomonadales bacterium]